MINLDYIIFTSNESTDPSSGFYPQLNVTYFPYIQIFDTPVMETEYTTYKIELREGINFSVDNVSIILILCYLAPLLIGKIPKSLVNLPNRDYWLSPENMDKTKNKLLVLMLEHCIYTLLLLISIFHLVYLANIARTNINMEYILIISIIYTLLTVYWVIKIIKSFKKPKGGLNGFKTNTTASG